MTENNSKSYTFLKKCVFIFIWIIAMFLLQKIGVAELHWDKPYTLIIMYAPLWFYLGFNSILYKILATSTLIIATVAYAFHQYESAEFFSLQTYLIVLMMLAHISLFKMKRDKS